MRQIINHIKYISTVFLFLNICSCKKLVQIDPPINNITVSQVFSNDDEANSAVAGIYFNMFSNSNALQFCTGSISLYCGMSADELNYFNQIQTNYSQFQNNKILSSNGNLLNMWSSAYKTIYGTNAVIQGLSTSSGVHDSVKNALTGESKFLRAYCYFYLTNLFGDIPLPVSTDPNKISLLPRSSSSQIFDLILSDLNDAQKLLPADYSLANGEHIRPNKFTASALLARVYLYKGFWSNAEAQATNVIESNLYTLVDTPVNVFLANSSESIWQLKQNNDVVPYNATKEGYSVIPSRPTTFPNYYLTNQLLESFEPGDHRKIDWIDSSKYGNPSIFYFYPYKYRIGPAQAQAGAPITEYYMMLRLAEQYLIRAEARAQQNSNLDGAIGDLNMIRKRAGLSNTTATTSTELLAAIMHERQVELFCEWGHRWFDLKRTDQATIVLGPIKSNWSPNAQLYPIPLSELIIDPNLSQNTGYE